MTLRFDDIPPADRPPATGRARSRIAESLRHAALQRRSFIKLGLAAGGAAALSLVGLLPTARPRLALANHGSDPRKTLSTVYCMGVNPDGDAPCWGFPLIGGLYCASDKYHRTDTVYFNSCVRRTYYYYSYTCGNTAGWYWRNRVGITRCTDGRLVETDSCSGNVWTEDTICQAVI